MNEVRALVEAHDAAIANGETCALATIVSVEGSSYRRPGAKMLITPDGATTGTISAGCLERDVIEHAKRAMQTAEAKLVIYDNGSTTDEMAWGLGLGCNGIVRVLIEPLGTTSKIIEALRNSIEINAAEIPTTVVTIYESSAAAIKVGSRMFVRGEHDVTTDVPREIADAILENVLTNSAISDLKFEVEGVGVRVFVEKLLPSVPLVIFGAGHDALPIVELAAKLGWQTEVVDPQGRDMSRERFAIADRVTLSTPDDLSRQVSITPRTMAIVMSHNYSHDLEFLRFLLDSPARYIGVMGPRKRTERILTELRASDTKISSHDLERIYSPVGLDIGANGPTDIALSVVAEMRAVIEGRSGSSLRESRGPIQNTSVVPHESADENVAAIILAAGSSSRMGRPKQALKFGENSFLRRSALAAIEAGCAPVIVVTGANADVSRTELDGLNVREVFNSRWDSGMGSSIAAGVSDLVMAYPHIDAALITLCDQPHVTAEVLSRLVAARKETGHNVIASRYGENIGVPALFRRPVFDELLELDQATGAKNVIANHSDEAFFISFPEGAIDVDTPEDYAHLIALNNDRLERLTKVEIESV